MTVGNEGYSADASCSIKARDFTIFWKYPDTGFLMAAIVILCGIWMSKKVRDWSQKQLKLLKLGLKLPGPPALPLIGNALQFACSPDEILDRLVDTCKHYDSPFRFWLGPKLLVVLTKPSDIEVILGSSKAAYKGPIYHFLQPFIGRGLISGSGPSQRAHRKVIMPMLNAKTLDQYVEYFVHHSEYCVNRLEELVDTGEFDIYPFMEHCTVDIILDTIMGTSGTAQQEGYQQLVEASKKLYELVYPRMIKLWLHPDWIYGWTDDSEQTVTATHIVHSFTESLIVRKQKEYHALKRGSVLASRPRLMVLEQLIAHVEKTNFMDDRKLRDEIFTLYTAAQDTTAVISSFVFLMLGMHQSVQEKVRAELHEVLGEDSVTAENLHDLKYVEMVVKETLRLFPIAPFMARELKGDVDLQTMTLPEGCSVVMVPYITHRDPNHWTNPDEFDPDRFAPENSAGRHSCAYVPFSGGLRGCIGQKYAMMCLKTIVANVVRRFRLNCEKSLHELRLKTDISIRSVDGYKISITQLSILGLLYRLRLHGSCFWYLITTRIQAFLTMWFKIELVDSLFGQWGTFAIAVGAVIVVWLLAGGIREWCYKEWKFYKSVSQMPGPPALPLIGNALFFAGDNDELLDRISEISKPYNDPFRAWLGPKLLVVIKNPRDFEVVFNSNVASHKPYEYRFLESYLGRGLVTESGSIHRVHRKVLLPMVTGKPLNSYIECFDRHSRRCVECLERQVDQGEFDVMHFMDDCTLDMVLETIMGTPGTAQKNGYKGLIGHSTRAIGLSHERATKLWLYPDWIYSHTTAGHQFFNSMDVLHKFTDSLVSQKKKEYKELITDSNYPDTQRNAVLNRFIAYNEEMEGMDDIQLRDAITNIWIPAQDPTALTTSFLFMMLGMHPDVQDKVRDEAHGIVGDDDITMEKISRLKYLEMVMKETIRLFPVGPLTLRELTEDLKFETCTAPKGCTVVLLVYETHRDPQYWTDPEKFIPERFTPENSADRHPYAFVPFSSGIRGCVGRQYATVLVKTLVARLVQKYRFSCSQTLETLRLKVGVSVRSRDGYKVSITRI
ncbi:uncharacterized protein LOC124404677 [Diprion similis]|uniref:uncharacterized protein LOC124404677 n=1 Tax=Diprion similis TaxID=362088 RepID=UPI001EF795E9|nr:uncharacterized protein LOC124404677 [Diprion similis]